jgi:hypothetical protein
MESHPDNSEVYSIRLRKARQIAQEMGGQKALAIALDRNPSQISSIIGKTPRDRIGDRMARRIEAVSGKDIGWLDQAGDPGARNKYTDIDFLERVIQIMAETVGDMGLPPRKLAYIIYNASLLRDQFQDSDLDELQVHIKELLSLALEN